WNEAAHMATVAHRAEVCKVAARCEDDRGSRSVGREPGRDLQSVDVRELHVEQHHVRMQLVDRLERGLAVLGLADHPVALGLEQHARARPEARVIVDYEDGPGHCIRNWELDVGNPQYVYPSS